MAEIFVVISCFLLGGGTAGATVLNYKPLIMEVLPNDSLVIQGFEGGVKVIAGPSKSKEIQIRLKQENPEKLSAEAKSVLDEWHLSVQRKGDLIEVAIRSPQSKSIWSKLLLGGIPQFYLEISAPAMPLEIAWRKGPVWIENWDTRMSVHLLSGGLSVVGGKGDARLSNGEGHIKVNDREGNLFIDSFKANLNATNCKGKMEISNFSGMTQMAKLNGHLFMNTSMGKVKLSGLVGRLDFENLDADLDLDGLQGEIRGQNREGSLSLDLKGEADVRIQSKEGPVSLRLPNSGASVNLGTAEGQLYVPNFLEVKRLPNLKWTRGRLRGEQPGSVYVRTIEGNIRIR